jgi:hypothetical protein
MGYVKVVKTSAYFSRYQVKYKRRWGAAARQCTDGGACRPCGAAGGAQGLGG